MPLSDDDRAALSAYLDGELDEESTRQVEVRMSLEPDLRHEYDTLRQTWGLLDYLPRAAPSIDFTNRTLERLTHETLTVPAPTWIGRVFRRVPAAGLAWSLGLLLALGAGLWVGNSVVWPRVSETENDDALARHLRVVERWRLYQAADDIEFVRQLDQPDLFGDEAGY
jgi:anti-sigma factor RsiW